MQFVVVMKLRWLLAGAFWCCGVSLVAAAGVPAALDGLNVTGYEYHRHTAPAGTSSRPVPPPLPLALVVAHREQVLGCHSFERFLSARWETVFVLEEAFSRAWHLADRVRSAPATLGAHLLELGVDTGEWLARTAALRLLRSLGREPPLLLSTMCDIHPLPAWHALHLPFEALVERWVAAFVAESAARLGGSSLATALDESDWKGATSNLHTCRAAFAKARRPLLAMNTPLLETLPRAESLVGAGFHSKDIGSWVRRTANGSLPFGPRHGGAPGAAASAAAAAATPGAVPWLSDVSLWFEDHAVLYNTSLLGAALEGWRLALATTAAGVKMVPWHACRHGLSLARQNALPQFYDRAWPTLHAAGGPGGERTPLLNRSLYAGVSMRLIRALNFRLLADVGSPLGCARDLLGIRAGTGHTIEIACLIPKRNLHPSHMPSAATDAEAQALALQVLRLMGYVQLASTAHALWLWRLPLPHGYRVSWVAEHDARADPGAVLATVAAAPPAWPHHFALMGTRKSELGANALLAHPQQLASSPPPRGASGFAEGGRSPEHNRRLRWETPGAGEILRIERNASLRGVAYPAHGEADGPEWGHAKMKPPTGAKVSVALCSALRKLRAREASGAMATSSPTGAAAQSQPRFVLPHDGPRVTAKHWLRALSPLEPFCA